MTKLPLQERVRQRIKQLVKTKEVPHSVLAKYLGVTRAHVTRMLNEDGAISLAHIEKCCEFFQVTAAELTTEVGALIQPLSPLEAAILDVLRKMDRHRQHSLLDVLEWQRYSTVPVKGPWGRKDRLTTEDEMVLSLYRALRDAPDEQAGIVMQMRGLVRAKLEYGSDAEPEEQ